MRRILNAHSRPLAPRWLLLGGVAALAATTNNGCSAAGAEHRTHGTQSANLEWLPAAPPRDLTHAPFLLGHSEPDPNRMVQVYVLLSEPAPAASIPRGIDLKSNSFNAQRSKQSFITAPM